MALAAQSYSSTSLGCEITGESSKKFTANSIANLNRCQKRALMIRTEGRTVSYAPFNRVEWSEKRARDLIPVALEFWEIPLKLLNWQSTDGKEENIHGSPLNVVAMERQTPVKKRLGQVPSKHEGYELINFENAKEIAAKALVFIRKETILIPVHQERRDLHSVLKRLQLIHGFKLRKISDLSQIPELEDRSLIQTMSRSFWSFKTKGDDLTTVKIGTDMIRSMYQPTKLNDVYEDVRDIGKISSRTRIPEMLEQEGVEYMADRWAIEFSLPGASSPYTISVRDYRHLLLDDQHFYVPYQSFFGDGAQVEFPGTAASKDLPLDWSIQLSAPESDWQRWTFEINKLMGKAVAIHHMNGYLPNNFHRQNLLVGIPTKSNVVAKVAIRDVSDIIPMRFTSPGPAYPYFTVMYGAWMPNRSIYDQSAVIPNLKAYLDQTKKMRFMEQHPQWPKGLPECSPFETLKNLWIRMDEKMQAHYRTEVNRILHGGNPQ
jgi:hypothetical protein